MALSLFFMKEYEKSAKIFEKYISKNPEDAVALEYAGRSYHLIKDYKKALEKYDKAIEIKPTSMLYQLKADCLSKLGRMKEALETLKKAEKLKK
jgi:tetratricopeptide (TPR) repeat protein